MKKLICIGTFFLFNLMMAQNEIIPTFIEKWENSKKYLVEIASVMPEDKYDFKPTEREMTFKAQLFHILNNMEWLSTTYFTNIPYKKNDFSEIKTKQAIIKQIEQSFNAVSEIMKTVKTEDLTKKVNFFAGDKTKLQIVNLLQDHVTHHRGQIIVYLNLNGVEPPKYVGW
jgi:uncharacterized damage-inducible protein DinB